MTYSEISRKRQDYNISQTKLAVYGGFSKTLISAWELGKKRRVMRNSQNCTVLFLI